MGWHGVDTCHSAESPYSVKASKGHTVLLSLRAGPGTRPGTGLPAPWGATAHSPALKPRLLSEGLADFTPPHPPPHIRALADARLATGPGPHPTGPSSHLATLPALMVSTTSSG